MGVQILIDFADSRKSQYGMITARFYWNLTCPKTQLLSFLRFLSYQAPQDYNKVCKIPLGTLKII